LTASLHRPKVLLLLGQSAHDPSSGAAQSMRQMAEALAAAGCEVHAICTSGCENAQDIGHLNPALVRAGQAPSGALQAGQWLTFTDRGVHHEVLITSPQRRHQWVIDWGEAFDARYRHILRSVNPHVVLTFGGDASDQQRWKRARQAGARIVFVLHNLAYAKQPRPDVDALWAPSHFLAQHYKAIWCCAIEVVPTPLADYLLASERRPRLFSTFINPEPAKGSALVAGLLGRWMTHRPDQPLLIVEGRAKSAQWLEALAQEGIDASECSQAFVSPSQEDLSGIWASTRVLLMPSVVSEAAGRVALEAMLNGVVPVVSARGALPETVRHPEWVVPLDSVERWDQTVTRYLDDEALWAEASAKAAGVARHHCFEVVAPIYLNKLLAQPWC